MARAGGRYGWRAGVARRMVAGGAWPERKRRKREFRHRPYDPWEWRAAGAAADCGQSPHSDCPGAWPGRLRRIGEPRHRPCEPWERRAPDAHGPVHPRPDDTLARGA